MVNSRGAEMRISTKTDLALRVLMCCAVNECRTVRKAQVADRCGASISLVAVVMHQLGMAGYLKTMRGRTGGIRLNAEPENISIGAVFRAFENDHTLVECITPPRQTPPLFQQSTLKPLLGEAMAAIYSVFDRMSLSDLLEQNHDLTKSLRIIAVSAGSPR
jgi:Rrf2 family nitric oxide-sensitive transcriptional repressor